MSPRAPDTASPRQRPVPLLMVEQPEEPQAPSSAASTSMTTTDARTGFARLTEGNMNEFLQQSLPLSDGWYTDGTLSEVSTPRLPSELDWTAAWSPSPSTLDSSGCSPGLMSGYHTGMCYSGVSPSSGFALESYNLGDFYLATDEEVGHFSQVAPAAYANDFLYPEYGNWQGSMR
ncbi:hypothetical protein B0T16DRAFT_343028 [Cercophora newfieldiana]|uniref:Uncharacterized protein n=1 Tax=Cercophora newfieldiana TaxID=92897 RepID=A0AA39YR69_9PEZI|nr:hypothetical protein B0T16DRAFT_343028 [Cercophora newfieldiana]